MLITQKLGIDLPIIQSPMAGVQGSDLAIAVSEAGALGSLPAATLSLDQLELELNKLSDHRKPYNVNFFCHCPAPFNEAEELRWRQRLSDYYCEYRIDSTTVTTDTGIGAFSKDSVALLKNYKPAVVSFHFGLPASNLLEQVKAWGSLVMSTATTVREAQWLEQNGADIIIAQGLEAGGHRGMFLSTDLTTQVGTLALVPQIIDAVNLPVIAAGGIASAGTVRTMMELGAAGVQIGTSYLLCDEADTSSLHRQALKSEAAGHTALTNVFTGRPARSIVNRIISEVGPISNSTPQFPRAGSALLPLRQKSENQGKSDFTALWSGQNNSGCREISATALTRQLAARL